MKHENFMPLAIIGYGCILPPNAYNPSLYWENILSGVKGVMPPPPDRWRWELFYSQDRKEMDKTYCKLGGFVEGYDFPYEEMPFSPEELAGLNRTQLMILDATFQAMAMAGYSAGDLQSRRTALFVGNMLGDEWMSNCSLGFRAAEIWHWISGSSGFATLPEHERTALELEFFQAAYEKYPSLNREKVEAALQGSLAGAAGRLLGLQGPAWTCDAACATGLLVVEMAARHLQDRSADMAVVCGAMGNMNVTGNVSFAKIGGLSGVDSIPLDRQASGLIPGEGAGAIIIKRLEDALRDGDPVAGVIRGIASRCDGKGKAIYAPSTRGQVAAMKRALATAGWRPEDLQYLETHATGTPTGDKVEIDSIKELFRDSRMEKGSLALGSVKSLTGHTFSAAGMANLIKILLGFKHETLPPTHQYTVSPPDVDIESSPFYVNTAVNPWLANTEGLRRAAANAFGFGGINTCICVEDFNASYHTPLAAKGKATAAGPSELAVAVTGIGCISPGAGSWKEYREGKGTMTSSSFPCERWKWDSNSVFNPDNEEIGYFMNLDFPWRQFRIPPKALAQIDRSQLMALMAAHEALQDSGLPWTGEETGVFIGSFCGLESGFLSNLRIRLVEYEEMLRSLPAFQGLGGPARQGILAAFYQAVRAYVPETAEDVLPGYMDNIIGGRIANLLDVRGVNTVIDAGEASFAAAVDMGIKYLLQGECATALVGCVHGNMTPEFLEVFRLWAGDEPPGLPAEGAVFFVLKKLEDLKDKSGVYGIIRSSSEGEAQVRQLPAGSGDHGALPFYFGAQGGFVLLDRIAGFSGTGKKAHVELRETFFSLSPAARPYSLSVQPFHGSITGSADREELPQTLCIGGDSPEELISQAHLIFSSLEKERAFSGCSAEELEEYPWRLAVVYTSREELKRKIKLFLTLSEKVADAV